MSFALSRQPRAISSSHPLFVVTAALVWALPACVIVSGGEGDEQAGTESSASSSGSEDSSPTETLGDESETDPAQTESGETDASETDGSETDGSETDGSETEGSETDESETESGETEGSETEGSETEGSETDASETTEGAVVLVLSCVDALQLPAGLSFHLTHADCAGDSCTWDYDPVGLEISQITGSYAIETGAFEWEVSYEPSHWRASTSVAGTADLSEGGDESSTYTVTTLDVLDVETVETVTLERTDCAMVRTTTDQANHAFVLDGVFGAAFTYTEGQIPPLWTGGFFPVDADGSRTPAGAINESISIPAPPNDDPFWWSYEHTLTGDADGNSEASFAQWNLFSEWSRAGICGWDITGRQSCEVNINSEDWGADVEWSVDYAGNGEGVLSAWFYNPQEMSWGPQDCPVTFENWTCSYTCPAGQSDDCRYFLME